MRGHLCLALFEHHRSGFCVGLGLVALAFGLYARRHREQDNYRAGAPRRSSSASAMPTTSQHPPSA